MISGYYQEIWQEIAVLLFILATLIGCDRDNTAVVVCTDAVPIGIDEVSPGGFTARDVVSFVGDRTFDALPPEDGEGILAETGPFTILTELGEDASATWNEPNGECGNLEPTLHVTVDIAIENSADDLQVFGEGLLIASALADDSISIKAYPLTADWPDWVSVAAELKLDSMCSDYGEYSVVMKLQDSLAAPELWLIVDINESGCGVWAAFERAYLQPLD